MRPDFAKNIDFIGQCDQGDFGGGLQVMVDSEFAYVGHPVRGGVSIIDVSNPRSPQLKSFLPANPGATALHIQAHGDLLLAANKQAGRTFVRNREIACGVQIYDKSKAGSPRLIGFLPIDGLGCHRLWYDGGRYAYGSIHEEGFSDNFLGVIDLQDPTKPEIVGRWWMPQMHLSAGEQPDPEAGRVALHHALIKGTLAYGAWRDGGLAILDISDPTSPKLVSRRNWRPPFSGGTHSPLPLPDRDLLVVGDEATTENCAQGLQRVWIFDVREPANPVSIATMPTPQEENFCTKGGKFGMHNFHENRVGSFRSSTLVFCAYQNAGIRVWDIDDPFDPQEVACFVPPPPPRPLPNQKAIVNVNDVYVTPDGLMYVSDSSHGLMILQLRT